MKKLSFKGDSHTLSKKRKLREVIKRVTILDPHQTINKPDVEGAGGWCTAHQLSDISGPIVICHTSTHSIEGEESEDSFNIIASDVRGSVFPLPKSTPIASFEPDDVRTVFTCTKRGDGDSGYWTLKNASEMYLSSRDGSGGGGGGGEISCSVSAISERELWTIRREQCNESERDDSIRFTIQAMNGGFLSLQGTRLSVADANVCGPSETFRIRIQRRNQSRDTVKRAKPLCASKQELERMTGRALTMDEIDSLRLAERNGELQSSVLDLRTLSKKR